MSTGYVFENIKNYDVSILHRQKDYKI